MAKSKVNKIMKKIGAKKVKGNIRGLSTPAYVINLNKKSGVTKFHEMILDMVYDIPIRINNDKDIISLLDESLKWALLIEQIKRTVDKKVLQDRKNQ